MQVFLTDLVVAIVIAFSAIVCVNFVIGLTSLSVSQAVPAPDEQLLAQPETRAIAPVPAPWMLELEEAIVVPKSQTSWTQRQMVLCLPPAREVKAVERKSRPKAKA